MSFSSDQGTLENGVLTIGDFEEGESTVTLTITVGTQSRTYPLAQLDIIHCQQHISFPNAKNFVAQVGSKTNELDYRAISSDDDKDVDCPISVHTATGLVDGITMDQNGVFTFSTEGKIPKTTIQISATVGSQQVISDPFEFEIIDCQERVKFPTLENVFVQVDSELPP